MNAIIAVWTFAITVFGGAIGAYVGSYLKQKGQNLATKEDINDVVTQVRAVTQATKEIEAKISSDVWDKQKQWEMKRDVVFDVARKLAQTWDALTSVVAVFNVQNSKSEYAEQRLVAVTNYNIKASELEHAYSLVGLVCNLETRRKVMSFITLTRNTARDVTQNNPGAYNDVLKEILTRSKTALAAMRQELGLEPQYQGTPEESSTI